MSKTETHQEAAAALMHGQVLAAPDTKAALDGLVELAANVCDVAAALVVVRDGSSPRVFEPCVEADFGLPPGDRQLVPTLCWEAYRPVGPL